MSSLDKRSNIVGISAGFHDAAVSVIDTSGNILFAGHSERYSKQKNDQHLNDHLIEEALSYGPVSQLAFYERPWMKKLQQLISGQVNATNIFDNITLAQYLRKHLSSTASIKSLLSAGRTRYVSHHLSHAAGGFQTSTFESACVVVVDAIGELDTVSIYRAWYDKKGRAKYKRLWRQKYPHSVGLFYSALTQRVGLHPLHEEYITMGMVAYGNIAAHTGQMYDTFIDDTDKVTFKENLHIGMDPNFADGARNEDLAASGQYLVEEIINSIMQRAKHLTGEDNLVYSGGVALNCLANRNLNNYFKNIWIMPNPGDAGSSLGAAALAYGKKLNWEGAYIGHNIPGEYPVEEIIQELKTTGIVGVANGRAEFGPRALGNRSLLADPRGSDIKDRVNAIKKRQQFRPFAPAILEEHARDYFRGSTGPYMQFTSECRFPDLYPAIVHADGTSRVQTVSHKDNTGFRKLLERWYQETGCPMLLNTSLNIRGEPIVNDRTDADRFEQKYKVKVCS